MSIAKLILSASFAVVLAACGSTATAPRSHDHHGHNHAHGHHHADHAPAARQQRVMGSRHFECQNGLSVQIVDRGHDSIELRLDDKRTVMRAVRAGSGEAYASNTGLFGNGAEWHQKGNTASFSFKDPYGNAVDTACQAK